MKPGALKVPGVLLALAVCLGAAPESALESVPARFPMACRVRAYIEAPDPKGLKFYSGPGSRYAVLKSLPRQKETPLLMIRAGLGNWMKVTDVQSLEGQLLFPGPGWIYGPNLATLAMPVRGSEESPPLVPLYPEPNTRSPSKSGVKPATSVRILYCQGDWVKVRAGRSEGWLAPNTQCGDPVRQCQ